MIRIISGLVLLSCLLIGPTVQALSFGDIGLVAGERIPERTSDSFHYQVTAGASVNDKVKAINTSQTPQYISLAIQSAHITKDNTFTCQSGITDAATWIKLSDNRVLVAPSAVTTVDLNLTVPTTAFPGEHNACLTATTDAPTNHTVGLNLQPQLAFRIAINVSGRVSWELVTDKPRVDIGDREVVISLAETNLSPVSLRSQNLVNFIESPPEASQSANPKTTVVLLPHAKTEVKISHLPRPLWGGWFKSTITTRYQPDIGDLNGLPSKSLSTNLHYLVWPKPQAWLILGAGGLTVWLIIFLAYKFKNRHNYRLRRSN